MTQIWWVRHGPTHTKTMTGWRDIPADLSDQAALDRLAKAIPQDAVVGSSDLIRSIATADAIALNRARIPPSELLREFDFGLWDGLLFSEIADGWPELSRAFWEEPGDVFAPDGESWNTAAARATRYVENIIDAHLGRDIVLVAHFGIILTQVAVASEQSPYQALAQPISPLSLTRIDHSGPRPKLISVNQIL